MSVVLDSSAVLAVLWGEPGADRLVGRLGGARISAVNFAELASKLVDRGAGPGEVGDVVRDLGFEVVPFDAAQATAAGLVRRETRHLGLSLGSRACIALALREGLPAVTADRAWGRVGLGVEVEVIR